MGVIALVFLAVLTLLGGAFSNILAEEFRAWNPWIVRRVKSLAVGTLPLELRERYDEEWDAYLAEIPGHLGGVDGLPQFEEMGFPG
ncbi:hypothetical protein FF124_07310 [Martelella lutilitoris]|uniref:ABC transporter permease n=1 Tax=Martelella lutilitoris TaxID=2583532 RepID=A0A5C4JSJ7_9HYPH|nr:hypothetical protein [Martelella lutilitoris]TNB48141.1 hypothetical protein FF124_07310 [Martelella lutilitoris]